MPRRRNRNVRCSCYVLRTFRENILPQFTNKTIRCLLTWKVKILTSSAARYRVFIIKVKRKRMCMKYCANNSAELCKHVDVTGLKRPIATGQGSKKFLVCVQILYLSLRLWWLRFRCGMSTHFCTVLECNKLTFMDIHCELKSFSFRHL